MIRAPMTRLLSRRTLWYLAGLFALIEAIFVADVFTSQLEAVLRNGGSAPDLALLILLKTPQIVDFALPIVILLGVFFAISTARDDNELIVYAAAGVPWTQIPAFALKVGLFGLCASVAFAGFVTPVANYSERIAFYHMETRHAIAQITTPEPRNTVRTVRGRTVIATPPNGPGAERGNLFVFDPGTGAGWRVSQADDWAVEGPREDGTYSVRLRGFRDYRGQPAAAPAAEDGGVGVALDTARLTVRSFSTEFRLSEIIASLDRTRRGDERLLFTWADLTSGAADRLIDRDAGRILGRALLCPFAALLAVAAAAWGGTRIGRFAALPVAGLIVLGADLLAPTFLADAAEAGPAAFAAGFGALAVLALALPLPYIAHRGEAMIAPGAGRA